MSKRLTNEEFRERFAKLDTNIELLGDYVDMKHKILTRCKVCGTEKEKMPQNILKGQGCGHCAKSASARAMSAARQRTHEQFVAELAEKNPDVEVIGTYVKSSERVEVRCRNCGRMRMAFPGNLMSGSRCTQCSISKRRIGEDEVRRRLSESNHDVELVGEYTLTNSKALFRCRVCGHEWRAVASSVMGGRGCPLCAPRKISQRQTLSHDDFARKASENNPLVEILGTYSGSSAPIHVRCRKCGYEWFPPAGHIASGDTGCPDCAGNRRITHEEFVDRMAATSPDIEVTGTYVRNNEKVVVRCRKCGREWEALGGSLLSGAGCAKCAGVLQRTHDEYLAELNEVNPYIEPVDEYVSVNRRMTFRCKKCGHTWKTGPAGPLNGTGCPACNGVTNSFFEYALLFALRDVLGEDEVISRDRDAIGLELDIYIPSMSLAFEPGSWFYHSKRGEMDVTKAVKCNMYGIKLVTIFTSYPKDMEPPAQCVTTDRSLGADDWDNAKRMISDVLTENGVDASEVDWKAVRKKALKFAGRITTEQFVDEMQKVNPDVRVIGEYSGARSRIEVECLKCRRHWEPIAGSLLRGHGCAVCARQEAAKRDMKTQDEFVREVAAKVPDVEVLGTYTGWDGRVQVRCKTCGREWTPAAGTLLAGHGCARCAGNQRKSNEEFVEQLRAINPTIAPLDEYSKNNRKIRFRCMVCGNEWSTAAANVLSGRGCPECGKLAGGAKRRKTTAQVVAELAEKNPRVKLVGEYRYAREKTTFRCLDCGEEFEATPDNMLRGKGCPKCRYRRAGETRRKNATAKRNMSVDFSNVRKRVQRD